MLQMYTAHPAETVTAVVVTNTETGERADGVDRGRVWFRALQHEAVAQIVAYPRTYELAGGFSIVDSLFMPFIDHIEGERESIIGLPWVLTQRLLSEFT